LNKDIDQFFLKVLNSNSNFNFSKDAFSELVSKVNSRVWIFSYLPFIKQVAVCNNLSFGLASGQSDIDLFIILNSKRFYTARFLITFFVHVFGWRRHNNNVSGRFCLSFFISDKKFNLKDLRLSDDDFYFNFWFKSLIFLKDDSFTVTNFLESNSDWFDVDSFNSNNEIKKLFNAYRSNFVSKMLEWWLSLSLFNWLENYLKSYQLKRIYKKNLSLGFPSGVLIKDGILKFHVKDARQEINEMIEQLSKYS
jgi:hypothetical protein